MAIISANRYGKLNGKIMFATNESYGMDDIGLVLQKDQINEMNLFNAILKSDMCEIKARTEGTMLESEIMQLQEEAKQNVFKALADKLRKFWENIKGVFRKAYGNLAAFCVKYGSVYVKANQSKIDALKDTDKVPGKFYAVSSRGAMATALGKIKPAIDPDGLATATNNSTEAKHYTQAIYKVAVGEGYAADKDIYDNLKSMAFKEVNDGALSDFGGKSALVDILKNSGDTIKLLKKIENEIEQSIAKQIKTLERQAKAEKNKENVALYSAMVSGTTVGTSAFVRSAIKLVKFQVAQARKVMVAAIGASTKTEASLLESMMLEAEEEVAAIGDETSEDLTSEQEELVDAIIDAAEALKDDGEETSTEEEPTGDNE